ncbi:unnamed protein product [marine sediment metagenome]|uniref:LicD family protein n=1 Tax=marine sediment metagenome TaxID=412755 RepID=X1SK21_9ZZZZ
MVEIQEVAGKTSIQEYLFLVGGALLGIIRDGDLIEWDVDIDYGLVVPELSEDIESKIEDFREYLRSIGFYVSHNPTERGYRGAALAFYAEKKDIKNDFDVEVGKEGDKVIRMQKYPFPGDVILPLRKIEFKGELFSIPNKPEEFLDIVYQEAGWRKPIKDWSPRLDVMAKKVAHK